MPIEYMQLKDRPVPIEHCCNCGVVFKPFIRGLLQRPKRAWYWPFRVRPYCAVICDACKEIIAWETP